MVTNFTNYLSNMDKNSQFLLLIIFIIVFLLFIIFIINSINSRRAKRYIKAQKAYKIGVTFKIAENNFTNNIYYGFWDTVDFSTSIIENLKEMFSGKIKAEQLMGPVGISEVVSKTQGLAEFVYMLALISLSLGITNLLPFPPLDGGKVVLLIIEGIRKKPIKEEIELKIQMAGFALLIALSIYVTYNDILRIF